MLRATTGATAMGKTERGAPEAKGPKPQDVVLGAGLGLVLGAVLYGLSSVIGPRLPAGWTDLLQGVSLFIGLVVALLGIRRRIAKAPDGR